MTKTERSPIEGSLGPLKVAVVLAVFGFVASQWSPFLGVILFWFAIGAAVASVYGLFGVVRGPCPYCGTSVRGDRFVGRSITCGTCRQQIVIRNANLYTQEEAESPE
jgi:hypothetical protein